LSLRETPLPAGYDPAWLLLAGQVVPHDADVDRCQHPDPVQRLYLGTHEIRDGEVGVPCAYLRRVVGEAVVALGEDRHGVYSPHPYRLCEDLGVEISAYVLASCRSVEIEVDLPEP
jgi:hypothetical protein